MPKYPLPKAVADALAEESRKRDAKCVEGWRRLVSGECRTYAQAADACGVTVSQFEKWAAKYHKGDIAILNLRKGRPMNSQYADE